LIVVVASDGDYDSSLTFVILAGTLLFFLCLSLGLFVYGNFRRLRHVQSLKTQAQKERSLLVLENAKQAAQSERELNDFIAHEVRNPLAAAMSACSFVASTVEAAG
jgi:signal transduction histidine kinase